LIVKHSTAAATGCDCDCKLIALLAVLFGGHSFRVSGFVFCALQHLTLNFNFGLQLLLQLPLFRVC
jgi:hypothetical protein